LLLTYSFAPAQVLLVLLKKQPPEGRKLLIVGTSSSPGVMEDMGIAAAFNVVLHVPRLHEPEIRTVLTALDAFDPAEVRQDVVYPFFFVFCSTCMLGYVS
jgi:vesicle-fusing ATPase